MLGHRPPRLLTVAWLLGWLATPLLSLALLAHVASDSHHDEDLTRELAFAASHGHSHSVTAAAHEHRALRESSPPVLSPMVAAAMEPAPLPRTSPRSGAEWSDPPPPTGSPPLFCRHCALLL
jgi:hypothetical protein